MARPRSQNPKLGREKQYGDHKGWRGRYQVYVMVNGEEVRRDRIKTYYVAKRPKPGEEKVLGPDEFYTKDEAQKAFNALVAAESSKQHVGTNEQSGVTIKQKPRTLGEAADRYLASVGVTWCLNFQRTMESLFRRHVHGQRKGTRNGATGPLVQIEANPIGNLPLDALTREDLQIWFNSKVKAGCCESTIKKLRTHIGAILELAVEDDYIPKNRMRRLKLNKREMRPVDKSIVTREQFAMLMGYPGRDGLIVNIAARGGCRPSEVMALRANDFLSEGLRIDEGYVPRQGIGQTKTLASNRIVRLPPDLRRRVALHIAQNGLHGEDFLFATVSGTPESQNNFVNRQMKEIGKSIGCDGLDFRMLRRSFATYLQKHGNVKAIQGAMGHASPDMSFGEYVQVLPEETADAVDALEEEMLNIAATLKAKANAA